ncbi:MAG: bifunctional DNA-formamidopyrimidine glycosylase/DNA-(apurinic or apyrimidinic site) lyase [Dehalococcoidia bacterium]|nr:MAG: bifunctional DNA-formamidopyrimidine glycosylase/DNA-(apurinic or apyrimidinic site) lyase [Dehalococcoidia bacterium]
MPELPEVETIKNELAPYIIGCIITDVTLLWDRMLRQPSPAQFYHHISGKKIARLTRRGKYLIFRLDSGDSLIIHLKMSGSLILSTDLPPKYTRAIIHLDKGVNIFFCDPRKFGRISLVKDVDNITEKLGPEPLESTFTAEVLAQKLEKRKTPLKAVLLNQALVAGIGNMYADEALFTAKINPLRSADSLTQDEIRRLHYAIKKVLLEAIKNKGASVSNYFRPGGKIGRAHSHFQVAHQKGKLCSICGNSIKRIPIRQRGSYYCPVCQPEKD